MNNLQQAKGKTVNFHFSIAMIPQRLERLT